MDNRRHKRKASNFSAEVYTRDRVIPATTENLSGEGVCLTLESGVPEDELVGVSMFRVDDGIENPDAEPINVPAKVVWCKAGGGRKVRTGMLFEDPPNDDVGT